MAQVDPKARVVRDGDAVWPFTIDVRDGTARITVGARDYTLHGLGWRAKRNLARFMHLGDEFLADQFLRATLAEGAEPPAGRTEAAALVALARWLNAPDGSFGLPLDRRLLAAVTVDVCRGLGLAPAAFETLAAADVEALWQAARPDGEPAARAADSVGAAATRIVVVPDPQSPEAPAVAAPPVTRRAAPPVAPAVAPPAAAAPAAAPLTPPEQLGREPHAGVVPDATAARVTVERAAPSRVPAAAAHRSATPPRRFRVAVGASPLPAPAPRAPVEMATSALEAGRAPVELDLPAPMLAVVPRAPAAAAVAAAVEPFAREERSRGPLSVAVRRADLAPAGASRAAPEPLDNDRWLEAVADELEAAARAAGIDVEG